MFRAFESRVLGLAAIALPLPLLAATAAAASAQCAGPVLNVVIPQGEAGRRLADVLREHVERLPDLDRCAKVTVEVHGSALSIEVKTGDGRVAKRQVESEAALLRESEALLTLPPEPAPAATTPTASTAPVIPQPSSQELPPSDAPAPKPREAAHVEFGAGANARLGGVPAFGSGGVEGFADMALGRWLLGVSTRWDLTDGLINQPTLADYRMTSTAVGVSVGRRFEFGGSLVDALLGPNVVLESQDADDQENDLHGSAADLRVALSLRVSGPSRSAWRAFASAQCEASPTRLAKQHFINSRLPPLPSWGSGLAVGVMWSDQ